MAEEALLRDYCNTEVVEGEQDKGVRVVLRDDCLEQNPLIIGLFCDRRRDSATFRRFKRSFEIYSLSFIR